MTYLYLGILLFGGPHLFSILFPALRDSLKQSLGEKPWKGLYSLVSLAGLVLMIVGFAKSRAGPLAADLLYFPADWTRHATMLLVLLAFILLGASHGKGYLKKWLHNPMSIGIALWATGHLLANGKRTDVYLFGTFLVVAVADILMSEARGKRPSHIPRLRSDIVAVAVGVVLYAVFLFGFHPYVLNLPVVR
ncbi:MAG TPA: NnrU family protein [Aestuariivirga sp.]|nr:NnrU family protein [Alphaproteobacteria bacterium]HRX36629.1 NnrU family protein [Aestuariivirga sp.]